MLPVPKNGYSGLFIEMKRSDGGRATKEQLRWIELLNRQGYLAVVCHGWVAAKKTIEMYLEEETKHE